jgi:nucleotide exchange factor SIL1
VGNEWLYQIHDFVELEDVADLDKLGGLKPVIDELDRPEEELRTLAAWVLGKASQNNLVVQKQVGLHISSPQ